MLKFCLRFVLDFCLIRSTITHEPVAEETITMSLRRLGCRAAIHPKLERGTIALATYRDVSIAIHLNMNAPVCAQYCTFSITISVCL